MSKGNPEKGYYSILQYIPNLERAEGVNIGVILFCPESKNIRIKISPTNDRVRRFFGDGVDLEHLDLFKVAFEERFQAASEKIVSLEDFRHFINTRGNQLQLTTPRFVKVFDFNEEITSLYNLLVCDIGSDVV